VSLNCIIPARLNSSRFPGKLLVEVQGKTILQRTFEAASNSPLIDSLYVATDDRRIADHVEKIGGKVLWTSSTPKNGTERLLEAFANYPYLGNSSYTLLVQGDQPCIGIETIASTLEALKMSPETNMSTAVVPIQNRDDSLSPQIVKCVFDKAGNALYFSRAPIPFTPLESPLKAFAHVGIYLYRTNFLKRFSELKTTPLQKIEDLEQLKVLESGGQIKIAMTNEQSPSVDIPEDLLKLESYLCKNLQNTFS